MAREILFKAKRIDTGEWVEGYFAKRHGVPFIYENKECPQSIYEIDESTLCQYTGLTDKNGNKIWENDVVWVGGTDRAIVVFSKNYSGYILDPIGEFYFNSPMLADNIDIIDNRIGTIFDNPELIKAGGVNE